MCIVWEKRQRIQKAMSMWLTWYVTMREQDEEEDKHGGSQPVSWRGGGGRGWRRGGQGSRLKGYHSIAHLFLRQPGRVLYGLTCAGHTDRKGQRGMRRGEEERGLLSTFSEDYVTTSNTERQEGIKRKPQCTGWKTESQSEALTCILLNSSWIPNINNCMNDSTSISSSFVWSIIRILQH